MNRFPRTTMLCILDGFGLNPNPVGNAVHLAKKPNFDRLYSQFPASTLTTHGERVGLPAGQMGNSEVGHLNIGAGRVVEQWLLRISRALQGEFLSKNKAYNNFLLATKNTKTIHLIGLLSDGGVHSHIEHVLLLIERLSKDFKGNLVIHLFTDGRDTSPQSGVEYVRTLMSFLQRFPSCKIGTICGRFYGMDRDKRWDRTERAYRAITLNEGGSAQGPLEWLTDSYGKGVTDEFIEPCVISPTSLNPSDGVVFWNFREDRMRQIVSALCNPSFSAFSRNVKIPSNVLCMTEYDHSFRLPFLFAPLEIKNHLGEVIAQHGLKQLRVAETEKYPHVTYFLNGGIEAPFSGEERQLVPSPRDVKTYDLKPEMSAYPVTEIVCNAIKAQSHTFIVVNLANCDMVGHTGVLSAATKAVETVDTCLGRMVAALEEVKGQAVIIADHGNAEQMVNYEDGTPYTAHTTFPVPVIVYGYGDKITLRDGGALCDIAPTILQMMGIEKPVEMTGETLINVNSP